MIKRYTILMPALHGWHRGERQIHQKLNYEGAVAIAFTSIQGDLPEQHREFHSTRLPFVPVTVLDSAGRPWGSILAGHDGKPGFIQSPSDTTLVLDVKAWDGDPIVETADLFGTRDKTLVAGIGIEFSTRRRNKFAGKISRLGKESRFRFLLEFTVNETIGNCPKYINLRDTIPQPFSSPKVVHRRLKLAPDDRLPNDAITLILESDTVFFGTSYEAYQGDETLFPSHVGMNHRGGRQGFTRVVPSDGRTVVLPDYSGNRLMTSLGNIEATPLACLTFVSFETGAILYLTGNAQTFIGEKARRIMPLQNTLTTVFITGYILVDDALPVRQKPGTSTERSPYSPPIRFLKEESPPSTFFDSDSDTFALLTSIEMHSPSIATFTWECSKEIRIQPGQAAIMDFTSVLGASAYQHMAPGNPTSVNDDRIRTWTVSSSHSPPYTRTFSITVRRKPDGAITGSLFTIAQKLSELKPEMLQDTRPLELTVRLVGISGDFVLPASDVLESRIGGKVARRLAWFAGGIGLTPFLSMLSSLGNDGDCWDIQFALSTREPQVLLPLILETLRTAGSCVRLTLDVFSDAIIPVTKEILPVSSAIIRLHPRLTRSYFTTSSDELQGRRVYICGPEGYEEDVIAGLLQVGIIEDVKQVKREGFAY